MALDDLGGAVHGAVEVRFLLDFVPAHPGFFFVNQAGAQVCINGHLLAGHGVQGKAGSYFAHPLSALGDDNELHQHDDEKDQHANDDIPLGDEVAERLDDDTGLAAVPENQPGGGDVQSQPKQCGHQQQ